MAGEGHEILLQLLLALQLGCLGLSELSLRLDRLTLRLDAKLLLNHLRAVAMLKYPLRREAHDGTKEDGGASEDRLEGDAYVGVGRLQHGADADHRAIRQSVPHWERHKAPRCNAEEEDDPRAQEVGGGNERALRREDERGADHYEGEHDGASAADYARSVLVSPRMDPDAHGNVAGQDWDIRRRALPEGGITDRKHREDQDRGREEGNQRAEGILELQHRILLLRVAHATTPLSILRSVLAHPQAVEHACLSDEPSEHDSAKGEQRLKRRAKLGVGSSVQQRDRNDNATDRQPMQGVQRGVPGEGHREREQHSRAEECGGAGPGLVT
mmetsp:Transcript_37073/g.74077  ORF Transcript_37073/g.74077 Transcript_37073/m.74077 type:complete len:328 (-) Transcript_37073:692-1675(-)